jgi:putative thioredoxin
MSMNDAATAPWVIDTTDDTFEADAIERSHQNLVVVDFWSDSCQPCRLLSPILEKVVGEFAGEVILVKANTDQAPQAAADFQVQSVPSVFALINGQLARSFQGLVPEEDLREWFSSLLRHKQLLSLKELENIDSSSAEEQYREILEEDPGSPHANIGLARLLAARGLSDEAMTIITTLEERGFLEPEAEQIKASLALSGESSDLPAAREAAAANPDDFQIQLSLSEALAAEGDHEEAMEIALSLLERDREKTGKKAHQLILNIFKSLPDDSELVSAYRRRLAISL